MKPVICYDGAQGVFSWWKALHAFSTISDAQLLAELRIWCAYWGLPSFEYLAYVYTPTEAATCIQRVWPQWEPLLQRRCQERVPVQYLVGEAWFYGRPYHIEPPCLIPRPETELLVEAVSLHVATGNHLPETLVIWEVGVGSGCLSLALHDTLSKQGRKKISLYAGDICPVALMLAEKNAKRYGVSLNLYAGSLLEAFPANVPLPHVVLANLPYIDRALAPTLAPEVLRHEGDHALFAEQHGFALMASLLQQAHARFTSAWHGVIGLEFGEGMHLHMKTLLRDNHFQVFQWVNDYAGLTRHVLARF
jgi:release factor glutamine methyltransferase